MMRDDTWNGISLLGWDTWMTCGMLLKMINESDVAHVGWGWFKRSMMMLDNMMGAHGVGFV